MPGDGGSSEWHQWNDQISRRRALEALGMVGAVSTAGCFGSTEGSDGDGGDGNSSGNDGSSSSGTDVETRYVGQELRLQTTINPEEQHFASMTVGATGFPVQETKYSFDNRIYAATHEPGFFGKFWDVLYWPFDIADDEIYAGLYEDWEIDDHMIRTKIRDDAYWSDGEPVRAWDAVFKQACNKQPGRFGAPPDETRFHTGFIGGYNLPDGKDGKVIEWYTPDTPEWNDSEGFSITGHGEMLNRLGSTQSFGAAVAFPGAPTHLGPYQPLVEEAVELWEQKPDEDDVEYSGLIGSVVAQRHELSEELHEWSRNPDNIVTHGPWTVSEIRGTEEIILEPNEHHRLADEINFDRVVFEFIQDENRRRASIQSERLDAAPINVGSEETDTIPDIYELFLAPAKTGYALGIDHHGPYGMESAEDLYAIREFRQALLYALDKEAIAGNINPATTSAITRPGFDQWWVDEFVSEEWAEENLIDYSQDLDKAEEKMREAGFERGDDGWWEYEGERFQDEFSTNKNTPIFETTVANQLQEFGLDVQVQTYESGVYGENLQGLRENTYVDERYGESGNFSMYRANTADLQAGYFDALWHRTWWWSQARADWVRRNNWFSHETQESALDNYADNGYVRGQVSLWEDWTVEIPPIGEPGGELETFNPSWTWGQTRVGPYDFDSDFEDHPYMNPPDGGSTEYYVKKFAWTQNYLVPNPPLARTANQHYINTTNWNLRTDEDAWKFYGVVWELPAILGLNWPKADPENPKPGAEVE
ncbi:ABC transporter substrate-binding protein [Natribaculum luteum]|uniref:ABC transporter substrate-binding protein n=1 Tax=Natribaculum luteum TaxID=1586232 RepID=A0ABD5P0B0_9EURY|nr:ABC transporter substrate-binding protein [Natribaculum luteum]